MLPSFEVIAALQLDGQIGTLRLLHCLPGSSQVLRRGPRHRVVTNVRLRFLVLKHDYIQITVKKEQWWLHGVTYAFHPRGTSGSRGRGSASAAGRGSVGCSHRCFATTNEPPTATADSLDSEASAIIIAASFTFLNNII